MSDQKSLYNEDYYQNGIEKGISLYEDYRWRPDISFPIAQAIKDTYPGCSVLDFGCARGGVLRALYALGVDACGVETSEYCLKNCFSEFVGTTIPEENVFERRIIFCKDVLEHISEPEEILKELRMKNYGGLFIIPLGDNEKYRIPEYHKDITHKVAENEEYWCYLFKRTGWKVDAVRYELGDIKYKWREKHRYGNGFFFVSR